MEPDFSGYATKVGLRCSDGRTILKDAFAAQHGATVPLVWQHGHNEPENVLGRARLENRDDGVYAYGYFNDTPSGQNAKRLVAHGDIVALSIYANQLVERSKNVIHGAIREVSLVLSGANPGALIDNVNIRHSDGDVETLDDEAVIYTGLTLSHADGEDVNRPNQNKENAMPSEKTVQDVFNSLTQEQKDVVYFLIGTAVEEATGADDVDDDDLEQSDNSDYITHEEAFEMSRNVFEMAQAEGQSVGGSAELSHSQMKEIVSDAQKYGSFRDSVLEHAAQYGIENIDVLFPDAKTVANSPEMLSRRMEWVTNVLNATKHSPFARIKSTVADITAEQARARGYVKGNLKKEEVIKLLKRVTTPTTIYKKQKLDRDDVVDITDFDVVAWLKGEMRLMLDEELARAILIGDGREPDDQDKIDEDKLRPIAKDADMYAHKLTIQSDADGQALIEAVLRSRHYYKGTGTPTFYTTDDVLTEMLLLKDKMGRRLYETEAALASALRVKEVVVVEPMETVRNLLGIVVNLNDYTIGADKGGEVSMFDDFDIDYNQEKYLIETRVSGALTKPKSAIVIRRATGNLVTPQSPSYDSGQKKITFPEITGVEYYVKGSKKTGSLVISETTEVDAKPAAGYEFTPMVPTNWIFTYTA